MRLRILLSTLVITLLSSTAVLCQEYGSVSGMVIDSSGAALPGVSVTITGPSIGAKQLETDSGGRYRFQNLPPATYTIQAALAGLGSVNRRAVVETATDTQVNVTLSPTVSESITVSAEIPAVDMKSTEVNHNYSDQQIATLPLARSYEGLLKLIPGVAESQSFAGGVNGGGSRQDNLFMVDGANVTNPYFGYLGIETNELDIKDFNVKRAGYEPEFGRSGGVVTNAITKSGTNHLQGAVRVEYQPKNFYSTSRTGTNETLDRQNAAFSVGGPLLRERVFGYASGRFARSQRVNRTNWLGPVPDEKINSNEIFGKVTANPTQNHFLEIGYRHKPNKDQFSGVGVQETPSVATNDEGTDAIGTAHWNWTATTKTLVEAKYVTSSNKGGSRAVTQLGARGKFDPNNLAAMGYVFDPNIPTPFNPTNPNAKGAYIGGAPFAENSATYKNKQAKGSVTQFFDFGPSNHEVKVGYSWEQGSENLSRISNAWGSITRVQNNTQFSASYYPDQPPQLGTGTTYGVYVQDRIQIGNRWVVNAGVLADKDEFSQTTDQKRTFLRFGFGDEIQPRVGVTYNVRPAAGDKVYAHYGRYYLLDQKSTARSLAPRRLFTAEAIFDLQGNVISDKPNPSTVAKNIAPGIKPPYTNEYLVGYDTPLGSRWAINSYFMYRDTKDFIEDFPQTLPNIGFIYNNVNVYRKYYALTLDLNRRFVDRWTFETNYTWSRLYGTYDQDYFASYGSLGIGGAIFNTSSGLFDGPGSFFDDPNQNGPLTMDRTHILKTLGSYQVMPNLTLGSIVQVQSGTPWNARGLDWNGRYLVYLEPAGAHRNPTWTNIDLLANYRIPLAGRYGIALEARVLNAANSQTALVTDPRVDLGGRIRLTQAPWIQQPNKNPNANYGQGLFFASPRRWVATVKVDF